MKFRVVCNNGFAFNIWGKTLEHAVRRYFNEIIYANEIKHKIHINEMYMKYDLKLFDGTGGAELKIVCRKSFLNSQTYETAVLVDTVPNVMPEFYNFDMVFPPFNPFAFGPELYTPEFLMGIICALADRVVSKYAMDGRKFDSRYESNSPLKYNDTKSYIDLICAAIKYDGLRYCGECRCLRNRIKQMIPYITKNKQLRDNGMIDVAYRDTENHFNGYGQAQRLKYFCALRGINPTQIARGMGMPLQSCQKILSGETLLNDVSGVALEKLSRVLNVPIVELIGM